MAGSNAQELKLLTLAETAAQFGVSAQTAYQWVLIGCPVVNVKGSWYFKLQDVIRWKKERAAK